MKKILTSIVPLNEGDCVLTWTHNNAMLDRVDGGISGFFKNVKTVMLFGIPFRVKTGEEFHGIIKCGKVRSTKNEL